MRIDFHSTHCATRLAFLAVLLLGVAAPRAGMAGKGGERADYLSLAQGAIPIAVGGAANDLKAGMDHALLLIDGDPAGFGAAAKPGPADTTLVFTYELPALTTFDTFVVPNVLETPSPSQTFFRAVTIAGSENGPGGTFHDLAHAELTTHASAGEVTILPVSIERAVRWVQVSLQGGIDVQRDRTFFEFSEIIGHGNQQPVPLSMQFNGQWKGRGVALELKQDGALVIGCYDGAGDLEGTVSGNILRATGKTRNSGIPSTFVLAIGPKGEVTGVRSTNGAPFRLYTGEALVDAPMRCLEPEALLLGCGSIIHGINFDFDSAAIRPDSGPVLDALAAGLTNAKSARIVVIGHTSSEGEEAYNDKLSQQRAEAVVGAMVTRGVSAQRVVAEGRGELHPIADNASEAGRSLNRRVEIDCH